MEAEKCLSQSERFAKEKVEFEDEIYAKVTFELFNLELFYLIICWLIRDIALLVAWHLMAPYSL